MDGEGEAAAVGMARASKAGPHQARLGASGTPPLSAPTTHTTNTWLGPLLWSGLLPLLYFPGREALEGTVLLTRCGLILAVAQGLDAGGLPGTSPHTSVSLILGTLPAGPACSLSCPEPHPSLGLTAPCMKPSKTAPGSLTPHPPYTHSRAWAWPRQSLEPLLVCGSCRESRAGPGEGQPELPPHASVKTESDRSCYLLRTMSGFPGRPTCRPASLC